MAAKVATVIMISTGLGRYEPQEYGRYLCPSDGTTIRKRSSHIPTHTPADATTQPLIVRKRLIPRMMSGATKLHTTIVQNSGENEPFWVTHRTATSASSLPYQVVSRSLKTKYPHRRLIISRSLPRF